MVGMFDGKMPIIAASAFVHELACVIGKVEIGDHCSAWPGSVIRGDSGSISIGHNVHIQDNCVLHTNNRLIIGDNVVIGHGAVVHCHSVGNNVLVGNNAVVLDDAEIGNNCVIAAGAVVSPGMKIADNTIMMGVPAKPKRQITDADLSPLQEGLDHYRLLITKYKHQALQNK